MTDPLPSAPPPCPNCGFVIPLPEGGPVNFCPKCGQDVRAGFAGGQTLASPWIGRVIADRYQLMSLLGEGGMGAVYKAEHVRMGKALAVKLLRGDFAKNADAVARFRSEAQIVSRLSHPHTIAVFDFGEVDAAPGQAGEGALYLAMEYVPGKDLATVLRESGRLSEIRAARIVEQVLGSLAEAHDAGVVHRDVKPGNIMLMKTRTGEDFVKVLDFGIAKLRDSGGSITTTNQGAIIGTPNYLAPEQARGEPLDARADLYSVGALLYELVSGQCPFDAPNPLAVVTAHLTLEPRPLSSLVPGLNPQLEAIVHRALRKDREERFLSADEMRAALSRVFATDHAGAGGPPVTPPPSPMPGTGELLIANRSDFEEFERQFQALKRGRKTAPIVLAVLVALTIGAAWRWSDVYAFLSRRAPAVVARLPEALRPSDSYDGVEHEPNNTPDQANPLPLPRGKDGSLAGGRAEMRGHVGAKLSDQSGDVDVFRFEIPDDKKSHVLFADWSAEKGGGIRGLDVQLQLHQVEGKLAKHLATVDRTAAGGTERLDSVLLGPGTYLLSVKEKHSDDTGPVEKPTDFYSLKVWLEDSQPGMEVEPNDRPESVDAREIRYPEWRKLAERNALGEGKEIHAATFPGDQDTFALGGQGPAETTELVALVPDAKVALTVNLWTPDASDLDPGRRDHNRFQKAAEGKEGELLFVPLKAPPRDAPVLLQVRSRSGEGRYDVVALGSGSATGPLLFSSAERLEKAGRGDDALELFAQFTRSLAQASARTDVLLAAGKLAERLAQSGKAEDKERYARAAKILGAPIFEVTADNRLRYTGAYESGAEGQGRLVEEAQFRLIARGAPCSAEGVVQRATLFLERYPKSAWTDDANLLLGNALEDEWWRVGNAQLKARAVKAYKGVDKRKRDLHEKAQARVKALGSKAAAKPAEPFISCR